MKKTELVLGLLILVFGIGLFVLNREASQQLIPAGTQHRAQSVVAGEVPLLSTTFVQPKPRTPTNTAPLRPTSTPPQAQDLPAQDTQPANTDSGLQDPD